MKAPVNSESATKACAPHKSNLSLRIRIRRSIGLAAVTVALAFFIWIPLGLVPSIPSMVDVFGIAGIRYPASAAIAALLTAAVAFNDF